MLCLTKSASFPFACDFLFPFMEVASWLYSYQNGFNPLVSSLNQPALQRRKANVKIDNFLSTFQSLISGLPPGSFLGPILFNIFLNDLLTTLENSEVYNFAGDNTISSISKEKEALLTSLEKDLEKAFDWFRQNHVIVNPEKFQSMILQRPGNSDEHRIEIDGSKIETTNSVDPLGIHVDYKLTFEDHIFTLCNKASM